VNYHLYYEDDDACGYVYVKHGEDWEEDDAVSALSCIRGYHESTMLFQEKPVEYRYVSIYDDHDVILRDGEYCRWVKQFYPKAQIMHESDNA